MKYLSIDIETTGLDPLTCDVLEVGAYLEDTDNILPREQLPCFHKYLWKDNYRGEPYALAMNQRIFHKILELKKTIGVGNFHDQDHLLIYPDCLWVHFGWWIYANRKLWAGTKFDDDKNFFVCEIPTMVVAGKNVAGFDLPFLKQLKGLVPKFHHRVIDPGMMYFDPRNDTVPPDLKECKKRAGLPEVVSHEALDDAWDVVQLVRAKFPLI
jgi:oligoribonuclease